MYLIDILLATYNGDKYLTEQIDSILSQTMMGWKLLIRDDGSSDQTQKIISHYVERYPYKIVHIVDTDKNLGVTHNFERLMEYSTAPYIMFCDQDDIWFPDKIDTSLRKLQTMEQQYGSNIPLLVYTDLAVCGEEGILTAKSFWKYQGGDPSLPLDYAKALVQNNATGNTFIFNRVLREQALPFSPDTVIHDWWVALTALYLGEIDYLTDQTILYRQHSTNVSGTKGKSILPILRKLPRYCKTLRHNVQQAESFLQRFQYRLHPKQINTLQAFTSLFQINRIQRLLKLLRFQFLTFHNLKDIGKICMFIFCSKKESL